MSCLCGPRSFVLALMACALGACGDGQSESAQTSEQSSTPGSGASEKSATGIFGGPKIAAPKATVDFDVVNIKPGLSADALKKTLESDGWRMTASNGTVVRVPGVDDYELPSSQTWFRSVNDGAAWRTETLQVAFTTALPREKALAYQFNFNRQQQEQQASSPGSGATLPITPQFTVDTFGSVKGKYGEPTSMQEGTCSSYNGSTSELIPIYHLTYARGADNPTALAADVGRDCRQSLAIQIQDAGLMKQQTERMNIFRSSQYQKESNKAGAKGANF